MKNSKNPFKLPDVPLPAWKDLYEAAIQWKRLAPWKWMDDDQLFGVKDPQSGSTGYACVLGGLGEVFALCVYRGAEGLDIHRRIQSGELRVGADELILGQNCLMAEFMDRGSLEEPDLDVIGKLGFTFRGANGWPAFRSYLPGYFPFFLNEQEVLFLTQVLHNALDFCARVKVGTLCPEKHPGECLTYTGAQEPLWLPLPPPPAPSSPPAPVDLAGAGGEDLLARELPAAGVWQADVFPVLGPIFEGDRPYYPLTALVVDEDSRFITQAKSFNPHQTEKVVALGQGVVASIRQHGRKPEVLQVSSQAVLDALSPLAVSMGFRLEWKAHLAAFAEVREDFENDFLKLKPRSLKENPAASRARPTERVLAAVQRAIEEKGLETPEEINEFLETLQGVNADDLVKRMAPESALDSAQGVMCQAWEVEDPRERARLARRALAISPDCADAYILLADEAARSPEEARELYQKAVEAGERALGPEVFKEDAGHFWGVIETRPYMRARKSLADCLWSMGRREEALAHLYEMLRLNTGDNQGIRYVLLSYLGEAGRFDEMQRFIDRGDFKDDCAADWLYTKALLAFRADGNSPSASKRLKEALEENKYAPDYLTGRKAVPSRMPDSITFGGEDEGYSYAAVFLAAWKQVPGALDWLRAETAKPKAGRNDPCPCGSGRKHKKCCGA